VIRARRATMARGEGQRGSCSLSRAEIEADVAALTQPAREPVRVQVILGEPFSTILGEAYRAFADVNVLGMHAKLGFPELFAGTTTERVTCDSPIGPCCSSAARAWPLRARRGRRRSR